VCKEEIKNAFNSVKKKETTIGDRERARERGEETDGER
jgi:hypothetical protein